MLPKIIDLFIDLSLSPLSFAVATIGLHYNNHKKRKNFPFFITMIIMTIVIILTLFIAY